MLRLAYPFKFIISFTLFSLLVFSSASKIKATDLTVSPAQLVVPNEKIQPVHNPVANVSRQLIDGPLTTYTVGGVRYWLNSNGDFHQKYQGPLNGPFNNFSWTKQTENFIKDPKNLGIGGPYRKKADGTWTYDGFAPWITNNYQISDSEILGIVHLEQAYVMDPAYTQDIHHVGLAYSNNGGESYTFLGYIIKYLSGTFNYNIQGTPYFIKDGYFYVYYKDKCPNNKESVARAPVSEVIAAARQGNVSPWKKYYQGAWTSNALGGPCSGVSIASGVDHTDAAYSTYTGKYYFLHSQNAVNGSDTWIKLYESNDGIIWTFLKDIVYEKWNGVQHDGYQYVTITDSSGSDNSVVGQSFYIYSAKHKPDPSVYRWLVSFTGPSTPTPTPTATPTHTPAGVKGYDVIIVAGQSNNHAGKLKDPAGDVGADNIYMLGRYDSIANNPNDEHKILPATEPLHNWLHGNFKNRIGYTLPLARKLKDAGFATAERPILIIPAAKGASGFTDGCWGVGKLCHTDLIERTNYVMNTAGLQNRIIGFFWIQGENDISKTKSQYEALWTGMMNDFDSKITGFSANTPAFVGQMVPSWFKTRGLNALQIDAAHKNLPNLRPHTYFVSSETPFEIGLNDEPTTTTDEAIHYGATSQRVLANRFYTNFIRYSGITPPGSPLPTPTTVPTPTGSTNPGDINGDTFANVVDIGLVIDNYNPKPNNYPKSDINKDGTVNILDIGIIVDNYSR